MDSTSHSERYAAVRRVLLAVLVANLLITVIKISLGLATGALSVVADGFHSLVDSSSNLIGLAAMRMAGRPPDERHPYGYRRYETLGALAIGGLLLVAAWKIVEVLIERITSGTQPEISSLALVIMVCTFPVNLVIVVLETRAGRRLNSEILLADAAHTRTDLYVTGSVIISLIGVQLGLAWLDSVVAAGVVVMILRAAFYIIRDSAGSLADSAGLDPEYVEELARGVPGVLFVHNVRSRGTSNAIFVDLHVKVDPGMRTSQAHAIASEVERRLVEQIPSVVDAIVHIEPVRTEYTSAWEQISHGVRQISDGLGLGVHDLHVHMDADGGHAIELHLEISGETSLGEAHQLADEFELRVHQFWPRTGSIITHLEPLKDAFVSSDEIRDTGLEAEVRALLAGQVGDENVLEVHTRQVDGHRNIAVRLCMPAEVSLIQAHERSEAFERELLTSIPDINRVVVHVEPPAPPE